MANIGEGLGRRVECRIEPPEPVRVTRVSGGDLTVRVSVAVRFSDRIVQNLEIVSYMVLIYSAHI